VVALITRLRDQGNWPHPHLYARIYIPISGAIPNHKRYQSGGGGAARRSSALLLLTSGLSPSGRRQSSVAKPAHPAQCACQRSCSC